jgi:hypothetical protein
MSKDVQALEVPLFSVGSLQLHGHPLKRNLFAPKWVCFCTFDDEIFAAPAFWE